MRKSVDFPAPFEPTSAITSPGCMLNETPRKAGEVGFASGCRNARQPPTVGGKNFSSSSMRRASVATTVVISESLKVGKGSAYLRLGLFRTGFAFEGATKPLQFNYRVPRLTGTASDVATRRGRYDADLAHRAE